MNVKVPVVLDVIIISVTRMMEPASVGTHGGDRDVMPVREDTGDLCVNGDVALDVIIMNVTMWMEPVPVNPH